MPIPGQLGRTYRVRIPQVLSKTQPTVSRLEARLGPNVIPATSGTYSLLDPAGVVKHSGAVTISTDPQHRGVATVTVPALTAAAIGGSWVEVWTLVYADGTDEPRRSAAVAVSPLHCPVTQADLDEHYDDLATMLGCEGAQIQRSIDTAWGATVRRLLADGRYPKQVPDAACLVDVVAHSALAGVFRQVALTSGRYDGHADRHDRLARDAWSQVRYQVDTAGDGVPSDGTRSVGRVIHRGGARRPFGSKTRGGF